jgi:hypothetical protein
MVPSFKSTFISASSPPALDLTPYIFKLGDMYVAGGVFGDVYRCLYRNGPQMEVRVWCTTHAASY